jgi:hypothetical protein
MAQTQAAAGDGFVTYDELRGPDLDAARWSPARPPLPTGDEHIRWTPNAELTVGQGEVQVGIPRLSLSDDSFQPADSVKTPPQSPPSGDVPTAAGTYRRRQSWQRRCSDDRHDPRGVRAPDR